MTASAYPALPHGSPAREFIAAVQTIMVKELRSRFRGRRAFVVLTVYLTLLALILYGVYTLLGSERQGIGFGGPATASAIIGQAIFGVLSAFELLLICFIAPGFTAGAISLEREKQTLDLLVSTPMRPGAIVVGKLLAALAFILLMITAAIPLNAIAFMYGGVTIGDLVRQQVVLFSAALGLGTIGLFFSALLKRTQAATVLTYCAMLALTVGSVLIFVFWTAMANRDFVSDGNEVRRAPEQLVWLNPAIAMADVVAGTEGVAGGITSGLNSFRSDPPVDQFGNTNGFGGPPDGAMECKGNVCFTNGVAIPCAPDGTCAAPDVAVQPVVQPNDRDAGYFWPRFVISLGLLSLLLTLLSMRMVVPAGMRFVFRRHRAAAPMPIPADGDAIVEEAE
jgi:ABC-type transport system involved in multi-copper enzyme maturation permease subunit